MDLTELRDGIKGVNWLTLLGPRYIEKLGGMAALKQQLQLPDVSVQETDNGRLMVQAGVLPDVGAQEDGHPPAYVAVNRVLKSVRVPHPDQLHTSMDDAEGFTRPIPWRGMRGLMRWKTHEPARWPDLPLAPCRKA